MNDEQYSDYDYYVKYIEKDNALSKILRAAIWIIAASTLVSMAIELVVSLVGAVLCVFLFVAEQMHIRYLIKKYNNKKNEEKDSCES